MTDQHPITPPSELLQQWATEYWGNPGESIGCGEKYIAIKAAQWGADTELEACCQALYSRYVNTGLLPAIAETVSQEMRDWLRAARRPKPTTLKEQALEAWEIANQSWTTISDKEVAIIIRRALEALPND
jgi:hypothetical protein